MDKINKKSIIYSLFLFLASRAGFSGIAPFGIAAFGAVHSAYNLNFGYINILLYGTACIVGAISTGVIEQMLITAFGILIYIIGCNLIKNYNTGTLPIVFKCSLLLVFSNVIPICFVAGVSGITFSDILNLIIQCILSFVMFYVFRIAENSIGDYIDKNITKSKINNEELICIAITLIIGFLGIPSIIIFGLSIRNIISVCIVMLFSLKGNLGTGAAAGIMIGILTNSSSATIICIYGFCGFIAGLLNKFGKAGVIISFVLGNIILCYLFGANKELILSMYETGFASIIFSILPKKLYDFIKIPFFEEASVYKKVSSDKNHIPIRYDYVGKVRNKIIEKTKLYSDTLCEMSSEILEFSTSFKDNKKEKSDFLRGINKVCCNCRLCNDCWKYNYKATEKTLLQCKNIISNNGDKREEVNNILSKFCLKPSNVLEELRIAIEIQRIERICNAKITENRSIIAKQLNEIGKISTEIGENIKKSTSYDVDTEKRIFDALNRNEIYIYDVIVIKDKLNLPEVYIYVRNKYSEMMVKRITEIISKILNKKMENIYCTGTYGDTVTEMKFHVKPKLKVSFGIKTIPAGNNDISGDSYTYCETEEGNVYLVLSDGMGTGKKANMQSSSVVKILELYFKSGIDISSALSTIDMILSSSNNEVNTASVDLCYLNRKTGKIYFSKMGAVPSIIVSENNIKTIEINRPPAGISIDFIDNSYFLSDCDVYDGDYIVMFTDGIYDGFEKSGINKKVMFEYIASVVRKIDGTNFDCDNAAEEICKKVFDMNEGCDDATIAIVRIDKN